MSLAPAVAVAGVFVWLGMVLALAAAGILLLSN